MMYYFRRRSRKGAFHHRLVVVTKRAWSSEYQSSPAQSEGIEQSMTAGTSRRRRRRFSVQLYRLHIMYVMYDKRLKVMYKRCLCTSSPTISADTKDEYKRCTVQKADKKMYDVMV